MPIDNRGEGRDRSPSDWERIETEQAQRDASARKWDTEHDPSEEFERAARPLPDDYGKDRPTSRVASQDQLTEMIELWGQPVVDRLITTGKIVPEGDDRSVPNHDSAPRADPGPDRSHDQTTELPDDTGRSEHDGPGDTAPPVIDRSDNDEPTDRADSQPDSERQRAETNAWDHVEGVKPRRDQIHVTDAKRVHLLDGDGLGAGGHFAGTGLPNKSEFPTSWDDDKIINAVEDVARNPDYPPEIGRVGRWEAVGTRDGVEIRAIIKNDGTILTGYPEAGIGVIHNDQHGNPRANETHEH